MQRDAIPWRAHVFDWMKMGSMGEAPRASSYASDRLQRAAAGPEDDMCARTSCSLASVLDVRPIGQLQRMQGQADRPICLEAMTENVRAQALGLTVLFCRAGPPFQGNRAKFAYSRGIQA